MFNDLDVVDDGKNGLQDEEVSIDNRLIQTTWYGRLAGSWKLAFI